MELNEPRPKKKSRLTLEKTFSVTYGKDNSEKKMKGDFTGFSVIIEDSEDMKNVISMGSFGKANFSRSNPQKNENGTEILRERQFARRKAWSSKSLSKYMNKVIIVPDSDDESDEYFTNLKARYDLDKSGLNEKVWLCMEEAFFLANVLDCLEIYYEKITLTVSSMWSLFSQINPQFVYNYIVYYHFKAKNWIVKPGIKFGGDYLLYKAGPQFYHASYVVIMDILDSGFKRIVAGFSRAMDNVSILALNRLCETAGKELLICQVVLPVEPLYYNNMKDVVVREVLVRRWIIQENIS